MASHCARALGHTDVTCGHAYKEAISATKFKVRERG